MAIIANKFIIEKDKVPLSWRMIFRSELTFTSKSFKNYVGGNDIYSVCLYEEDDKNIYLPVKYGLEKFSHLIQSKKIECIDLRPQCLYKFEFNDDLWMLNKIYYSRQKECIDKIIPQLLSLPHSSGMIYLTTGSGKTAIALKALSMLGGPAIILLHRDLLLKQWYVEIKKWMPKMEDYDIGIVQQKLFGGYKKIVLAMIQTLLERKYEDEFYKRFNMLIVDEAHHISSECFSKVVPMFNTRYRLGLLGQAKRGDNMDGIYKQEIGDIIYRNTSNIYDADFYQLVCNSHIDSRWFTIRTREGNKISVQKLINLICKDYKYREYIVKLLKKLISEGKKVVVLAHRVEFCKFLYISLKSFCKSAIAAGDIRQDVKNCDLAIATYQMLGEGIDLTEQDTIVLATPTANINQAVGRILRGNKHKVTIIDIKFNIDVISHWFSNHRRLAKYRQWNIIDNEISASIN